MVGDLDQALHVWRYTGGFAAVDKAKKTLSNDEVCRSLFFSSSNYALPFN